MTALETLLVELTKLEKKATPGAWGIRYDWCDCSEYGCTHGRYGYSLIHAAPEDLKTTDYELIAASRSALPKLIEIIRVQQGALKHITGSWKDNPCCERAIDGEYTGDHYCELADTALEAAERIAKGGDQSD
jgi:hypothetical protein